MAYDAITKIGTYIESVKPIPKVEESPQVGSMTQEISITSMNQDNRYANEEERQAKEEQAEKQLRMAISEANTKLRDKRTGCEFTFHEETHRVLIKVFDKDTKEVIREIPSEDSLEMVEKIWELAGLLVDEKR